MKIQIVGMRIEKHYSGRNFEENKLVETSSTGISIENRFILFGINKFNQKLEITLWREYGLCSSGCCEARWGRCEVNVVNSFGNMTHRPIKNLYIDDYRSKNIKNEVFEVNYDGGNHYYPYGDISVNMKLFENTRRSMEHRPVWIFVGSSNIGKSYIARHLELAKLNVYETDSSPCLPKHIYADVVVKGNKYDFSLEEIDKRICGEHKLITVEFKE